MIVTTHKKAKTFKKSLPLFFIIKKLKTLCKEIARISPKTKCTFFLNPSRCIAAPSEIPTIPLVTVWRSVAPKKRSCPVSSPTAVAPTESGSIKNKAFSSAAKPKAPVIIYIGQSIGSSVRWVRYITITTAKYFTISSAVAQRASCISLDTMFACINF